MSQHDPFAPREGRHLQWRNITMTLALPDAPPPAAASEMAGGNADVEAIETEGPSESKRRKTILHQVFGEVPPGQTTAIMGPSGSGKTSLLNVLSGRTQSNKHLEVKAEVRVNNFVVNPTDIKVRQAIAFVAQDDSLQATATVREAILFSAKLRLSKETTDEDLDRLVSRMISELGLQSCADTIVGSALIKGISGGERKRASVGVELVVRPALVFLDEPTSGLDSYSAMQLCKVLKKVAAAGSSVLFTIHQPSSEIFKTFDHALLLKDGRILHTGSVHSIPDAFAERGFPVPEQHNPADWIMEVAQSNTIAELEAAGFFQQQPAEWGPPASTSQSSDDKKRDMLGNTLHEEEDEKAKLRIGWVGQTKLLFAREVVNFQRNKHALKARTAMSVAISIFIGIIFFDVAQSNFAKFINVQATFGALLMALLANVFSTVLPSLLVFPQERPVFLREYSTNHYGVAAYFASRMTMEFIVTAVQVTVSCVITYFCTGFEGNFAIFYLVAYVLAMTSTALGVLLGSSAEDPSTAIELLPGVIMPQILFSGFFTPPDLMPDWLAWIRWICPLTYAVRIGVVNEFDGRCDDMVAASEASGEPMPNYCDAVLGNVDVDPDETWWNWVVLAGMFVFLRLMALLNLRRKANKFY